MTRLPYVRLRLDGDRAGRRLGSADLAAAIRRQLVSGSFPPGSRIPPVRVLEHQLGTSKNTVQAAYDELAARGLLESRSRQGVFVARQEPGTKVSPSLRSLPRASTPTLLIPPPIPAEDRKRILLSSPFIDPGLLPRKRLGDCFRSVLRNPGLHSFHDSQGYPPLREAIARRLSRRGIPAEAAHVVVTVGSQQALDVVCRALARKVVATESPAYHIGKSLFEMSAIETTGLPLDPFRGIDLDIWESRLAAARPSLLYLTTRFQNPTGYSYSTAELLALVRLSKRYGFGILEDDWGSDMLSYSDYHPAARALGGDAVLYMNSFTKKLLPSLRLGFVVGNAETTASLVASKRVSTLGNPAIIEAALFEFLDRGYYDAHLTRLHAELDRRYQVCLQTLRQTMPEGVAWTTPGGGPLLWLDLPRRVSLETLQRRLAARGVGILLSRSAFFTSPHLHGFRVGYAFLPTERLQKGLTLAAEEIRKALRS